MQSKKNQIIYLFNGMQNDGSEPDIIQPVLKWGVSDDGGGARWSVASWYVTGKGEAFHTQPVPVNVGDTLVGVITLTGKWPNNYNYEYIFLRECEQAKCLLT